MFGKSLGGKGGYFWNKNFYGIYDRKYGVNALNTKIKIKLPLKG